MIDSFTPSKSSDSIPLEVALPMPLNHGWVAHACRAAGLPKPRWSHLDRVWKVESKREGETVEVISIREGASRSTVSVSVGSGAATGPDTARRVVTALVTGMQWALARRAGRDRPL